jgi:hypothetical protein
MSTDAGSAAPEDTAVQEVSSERPGLESADPGSADSATSTAETADRGVEGSARTEDSGAEGADPATDTAPPADDTGGSGRAGENPADEGFVAGLLRDSTITGLPGETGAPPVEPHAPQAQQQGDEPVGAEPPAADNPDGVD